MSRQRTIANPISLKGVALHSGLLSRLQLLPALADTGIVFVRDGQRIPALVDSVVDTQRGTSLTGVAVIEHLLSALYGLAIDNLAVRVLGEELPALDGSALPYVEAIEKAGIVEQAKDKKTFVLRAPVKVSAEKAWLEALPYNGFKVDFMVDFPGVGPQNFLFELGKQSYQQEIAPARTFGYLADHEELKRRGLALGASQDNALVLGKDGYFNSPRFANELVRHKILDLLGDLCLLGRPLQAEIRAVMSGHALNVALVRRLREQ